MANIKTLIESIDICRKAGVTLFVWGHRGIGKSSIIKQYASNNNLGLVDLRCSQIEASDLRGLPDCVDGKTHYMPPFELPRGGLTYNQIEQQLGQFELNSVEYNAKFKALQPQYQNGILLLDEVNRAQDDVLQAVFELIYDKSIGQYILPVGWNIIAAGNFIDGYITNGFTDPAFLDRFCHITLSSGESTFQEWVNYMSIKYSDKASDIIEFTSYNIDHLDGNIKAELGFNIEPSRRSWEAITKIKEVTDGLHYNKLSILECYSGLIGRDLAISFMQHSCPIKPINLIKDGITKHEKGLNKLSRNQLSGLMWGLVAFSKNHMYSESMMNVCLDFAKYMVNNKKENDLVVAFCRALITSTDESKSAAISNPQLAKMISKYEQKKNTKKDFLQRLTETPELQDTLAKVAWGDI